MCLSAQLSGRQSPRACSTQRRALRQISSADATCFAGKHRLLTSSGPLLACCNRGGVAHVQQCGRLTAIQGQAGADLTNSRVTASCVALSARTSKQLLLCWPQARAKVSNKPAGSAPVEFLVRDAEATDLPDAAFDLVLCSNGMAYLEVRCVHVCMMTFLPVLGFQELSWKHRVRSWQSLHRDSQTCFS